MGVKDQDKTTGYLRQKAYLEFCQQHQLDANSIQRELGYEWVYLHVSAVLSPQVSALVCATDRQAIGAIKYLPEYRLQHIQVCSMGNNPLLHFLFSNFLTVDLGYV